MTENKNIMEKPPDNLHISNDNLSSMSSVHRPQTDGTGKEDLPFLSPSSGPRTLLSSVISSQLESISGRGVKRKLDTDTWNETRTRKRQKVRRYEQTIVTRGEKRKSDSDHYDQPRKRFKAAPPEVGTGSPEIINEPTISNLSVSNIDRSASCSDSKAEFGEILNQQAPEGESLGSHNDQADDINSCPESCVCRVGHSRIPHPIERYFDTPLPLHRCLIMRRLYSLSNTQYTCCPSRCVRRISRERVMHVSLRHMNEDYDPSDLRVSRYSWGEWKE